MPPTPVSAAQVLPQVQQLARRQRTTIPEAERIKNLPTWDPESFSIDLTDRFKTPGGTMRLTPIQSIALHWITEKKGLLGILAVGAGKGLISLLAPVAMKAQRPVLFIPPTMQVPLRREVEKFAPHFRLPTNLNVIPYSQLSVAKSTDMLERLQPDLIICDESHNVANVHSSARARRVLRYAQLYPETRFVALSGTISNRSLKDYAHISELCLRNGSPIPLVEADLVAWAACVDAKGEARESDWRCFASFADVRHISDDAERREEARTRYRQRLVTTPGVVATKEGSVGCSLVFFERSCPPPGIVTDALRELRRTWDRPDGEALESALDAWRCGMQMSQGFYTAWDWPSGIVDTEWMSARSWFHKEVRAVLQQNRTGLDSPFLVRTAVINGKFQDGTHGSNPSLVAAWHAWDRVRDRPQPPTKIVWLSDYLVKDALKWRKNHPDGIVWFNDLATEQALRAAGERVYGAGEIPPYDGKGVCLSVRSHGVGMNLQAWSDNLVLSWPSSGKIAEQLIGRTHRQGQEADEVIVYRYANTKETQDAVANSRRDAKYLESTTGSPQKLLVGTWA